MNESDFLADGLDNARQLTRFYLSKLKEVDPFFKLRFQNGVELNSYYWIVGHLCWAENLLVNKNLEKGVSTEFEWLDFFALGANDHFSNDRPDFKVVLEAFKTIHANALKTIREASIEELNSTSVLGFNFGNGNTVREILKHAIRHESVHCGHLGLICKISNIPTL
jgi:hypothetical protein